MGERCWAMRKEKLASVSSLQNVNFSQEAGIVSHCDNRSKHTVDEGDFSDPEIHMNASNQPWPGLAILLRSRSKLAPGPKRSLSSTLAAVDILQEAIARPFQIAALEIHPSSPTVQRLFYQRGLLASCENGRFRGSTTIDEKHLTNAV